MFLQENVSQKMIGVTKQTTTKNKKWIYTQRGTKELPKQISMETIEENNNTTDKIRDKDKRETETRIWVIKYI